MKRLTTYLGIFLLILGLTLGFFHERDKRILVESTALHWKENAHKYKVIPTYNGLAEDFVQAFNGGEGEHSKMLTGEALNEYKNALKKSSDYNDEHSHHDDLDTSLINTNILITQTEVDENDHYHSKVMYEVDFDSPANSEEQGVIDKRIVTMIMEIDWKNKKVDRYKVSWFNDTLGTNDPSEKKKVKK